MYFIDFSTTHKNFFEKYSVFNNLSMTMEPGFKGRSVKEKELFLTVEKAALEHALIFYDKPRPDHLMYVMEQEPDCAYHSENVRKLTKRHLNQTGSILIISALQHKLYEKPQILSSIKREAMSMPFTNKLFFIASETQEYARY